MTRVDVVMIAAILGIEIPTSIQSKGLVYPVKAPPSLCNEEQRKTDREAKRRRKAKKLVHHVKMGGLKATMIVVDEIEP